MLRYEGADGAAVLGLVVEPQLWADDQKRFSWPAYEAVLRSRWRCDACVLVVTPSAEVARWADAWIPLGPYSRSRPLVIGPHNFPRITDPREASDRPHRAILSALIHKRAQVAEEVLFAGAVAALSLDDASAAVYYDLIIADLNEVAMRALEAMMNVQNHEWQSEFARKYVAEGKAQGVAQTLLMLLDARGITLTEPQRARVTSCGDANVVEGWFARALDARSADDIFCDD